MPDAALLLEGLKTLTSHRTVPLWPQLEETLRAARLQTLDSGAPVSEFTVARELGHGGESMIRRVYRHLGHVRQRAEYVEYRVEPYAAILGDRLTALQARLGTVSGTTSR